MAQLWTFTRPYAPMLAGALAVMALRAVLIAGVAYLVKPIFDEHLLRQHVAIVRWAPLLVLVFYACKTSLEYLQTFWIGVAGDAICRDMRRALQEHIVDLPLSTLARTPAAAMVARVVADVGMIQSVIATTLLTALKDAFSVVALGTLLVYENARFDARNQRLYTMRRSARHLIAASSPVSEMVLAFAAAAIVGYGGREVLSGHMTLGELASFFVALGLSYEPVKRLSRGNLEIQGALGAFDRTAQVLDEPTEPPRDDRPPLVVDAGAVEFRHVHFAYETQP